MKNLFLLSFFGITVFSYGQNYLPNVLIVKIKEPYRGYFYKGEANDPKLEMVFNGCGVKSIVRKFPNCVKPRTEKNKDGITHPDLSLIYQIEYTKDIFERPLSSPSQVRDPDVSGLYDITVKWLRTRVGNPCIDTLAHRDTQIDTDTHADTDN